MKVREIIHSLWTDDDLTSPHGTGPDVAHFARFNKVMESFHCLFWGHAGVKSLQRIPVIISLANSKSQKKVGNQTNGKNGTYVNLKQINVIRLQPLQ